jgi:hypothetical protein
MYAEHGECLGRQRDAHFAAYEFRGASPKHRLQLVRSFQRRAFDGDVEHGLVAAVGLEPTTYGL